MQHKVSWDIQDLVGIYETIMMKNPDKYEPLTENQQNQIWYDLSGVVNELMGEHITQVLEQIEQTLKHNLKRKDN